MLLTIGIYQSTKKGTTFQKDQHFLVADYSVPQIMLGVQIQQSIILYLLKLLWIPAFYLENSNSSYCICT